MKSFLYATKHLFLPNIINVPKEKLVVIQGLDDYIIVESNSTLLICKKDDEQQIKQFVADVKREKGESFA